MVLLYVFFVITVHKRSLGQGNVFTPVCHSVHRGVSVPACITGRMTGGLCPGGSLSGGVPVQGVSVQGSLCPGGSLYVGVSVRETPSPDSNEWAVNLFQIT